MRKLNGLFAASLIFAACGSSSHGTDGGGGISLPDGHAGSGGSSGSGGSGGTGGTGGTGGSGGANAQCNQTTGQGCVCPQGTTCPNGIQCIILQDMNGAQLGGPFCSNMCTSANQATTCALASGAPGMGGCFYGGLDPDAGTAATNCGILCGTGMTCPSGMTAHMITSGGQQFCICTG